MSQLTDRLIDTLLVIHRHHARLLVDAAPRIQAAETLEAQLRHAGIDVGSSGEFTVDSIALHVIAHGPVAAVLGVLCGHGHPFSSLDGIPGYPADHRRYSVIVGKHAIALTVRTTAGQGATVTRLEVQA